jgi:organic hydroperoxide reductase OsmC/OhrA
VTRTHRYQVDVTWTGNLGAGTHGYGGYSRAHEVRAAGRSSTIPGSADAAFRGDPERWNPEELLVAALAQCHMLWYLHLCAVEGIVVTAYVDHADGHLAETAGGGGHFVDVTLRPEVTIATPELADRAVRLHEAAHQKCFIANSVNFPVVHEPVVRTEPGRP